MSRLHSLGSTLLPKWRVRATLQPIAIRQTRDQRCTRKPLGPTTALGVFLFAASLAASSYRPQSIQLLSTTRAPCRSVITAFGLRTKDGGTLRTILDTGDYMIGLSKGREMRAQWQRAAEIAACGRGHRRSASRLNLRCSTTPSLISLRWLDDPSFYVASKRARLASMSHFVPSRAPTYPAADLRRMLP